MKPGIIKLSDRTSLIVAAVFWWGLWFWFGYEQYVWLAGFLFFGVIVATMIGARIEHERMWNEYHKGFESMTGKNLEQSSTQLEEEEAA